MGAHWLTWHRGLMFKVGHYGISGHLKAWLESYLSGRMQRVKCGNSLSPALSVESGVPQGSILGPLLFVLYVNDLPMSVPDVSLFADDTTVTVAHPKISGLQLKLQSAIADAVRWMRAWKLSPNLSKTEAMLMFPSKHSPVSLLLSFPGCNDHVRLVQEHKHLGVVIHDSLTWKGNAQYICDKTSRAISVVSSHCSHVPVSCRSLFYRSYILPSLIMHVPHGVVCRLVLPRN